MELDTTTERLVSAALLRLRMRAPFFATLALFARIRASTEHPTAATDGCDVFINPTYFQSLDPAQQDAILLHAVLHAACSMCRGAACATKWSGTSLPILWSMASSPNRAISTFRRTPRVIPS
jgi:predicted metal-dependent peptidase